MQEQLLTKCPHCGTTFRLSKEHLKIAGGAVRCGSCYQVFHASEHIIKTAIVEEVRQPAPPRQEAPDPFEEFELDDGDPYQETPDWNVDEHPDADLFAQAYDDPTADEQDPALQAFGIEPEAKPSRPQTKNKNKNDVDESWAEALLLAELGEDTETDEDNGLIQDDPIEDNNHKPNTGFGSINSSSNVFEESGFHPKDKDDEISDSFRDLRHDKIDKFGIDETHIDAPPHHNDESWAQKMLEELEAEEAPQAPSIEELSIIDDTLENADESNLFAAKDVSRNKDDAIAEAKKKAREEAKQLREKESAIKRQQKKAQADEAADPLFGGFSDDEMQDIELGDLGDIGSLLADDDDLVPDIEPPAADSPDQDILEQQIAVSEIHFGQEPPPKKKRAFPKTAGLVLLNVFAIIGLVAQHAYFNFDDLARQDSYRPFYKMFCNATGCELPIRIDTSKIQAANLMVRSHPMEPNAMVIDFIAYNRAKYPQPYPDLKLSFEDINGKPVASRQLQPQDYVQDQSIDLNAMPPNTPVHITIEIIDPGPQASNYQIDFIAQ